MDLTTTAAGPLDLNESAVGRPEQLVGVGRSDPALRGLNDHATSGRGPTRQSNARDSEPLLVVSCWGTCLVLLLSDISVYFFYGMPTLEVQGRA